jgi:hypothetical protein
MSAVYGNAFLRTQVCSVAMFAEYRCAVQKGMLDIKWNGFTNLSDVDKPTLLCDEGRFSVFKLWAILDRKGRP